MQKNIVLRRMLVLSFILMGVLVIGGCDWKKDNSESKQTPLTNNQSQNKPVTAPSSTVQTPGDQGGKGAGMYQEVQDYSVMDEDLPIVEMADWTDFENAQYGYSLKYPAGFTCSVNESTLDCTKVACKQPPAGEVLDLEKVAQNRVTCKSTCEIIPGQSGCIPAQISISTYPNISGLNTKSFCDKAGFYKDKCAGALNFAVSNKSALRYGFKYVPFPDAHEASSISDFIYVSAQNKNYLISSETEEDNVEGRSLINGIISQIVIQ